MVHREKARVTALHTARPTPTPVLDSDPVRAHFRSDHYTRINLRRLEHLATLGLVRRGMSVLELGAGIGDLTGFFLDRACRVTQVEGRTQNIRVCLEQLAGDPRVDTIQLDLDHAGEDDLAGRTWNLVFAYGLLYHLENPADAIAWMARRCDELLLIETCVTPDDGATINPVREDAAFASQALRGGGCRPTRAWVRRELATAFPHVYTTRTQPNHDEFPLDWTAPAPSPTGLHRAIFAAAYQPILSPHLTDTLINRHEPSP